jgi:undecaprenyl diphosphate synthase
LTKTSKKDELNTLLAQLDMERLPAHVAIIMDGNGRWAKKRGLARSFGHRAGVENVKAIIRFCSNIGIKALTLFAFSTENWKRPSDEVGLLMSLLLEFLKKEIEEMHRENARLQTLGDIDKLPEELVHAINAAREKTKDNTGLIVNIAVNYGARAEIIRAVTLIAQDAKQGKIQPQDIDENLFSSYLYTRGITDPDLVIRTSGELRISNFLLYQSAYAEYIFTDILWPDLNEVEISKAFLDFQQRQRRFGGI